MSLEKPVVGVYLLTTARFDGIGDEELMFPEIARRNADKIISAVSESCEVVFPGIIRERSQVRESIDLFCAKHVDCVVAAQLTWTEDFAWNMFLRDMPECPVFYACIQPPQEFVNTYEKDSDFARFLSCNGLVGHLQGSGDVKRMQRKYLKNFAGTLEEFAEEFKPFARACALKSKLFHSTWGQLGGNFEVMWSTYLDPYMFFKNFGPELKFLTIAELESEVEKVDPEYLQKTVDRMLEIYPLGTRFDKEKFIASVRASLAVEAMIEKYGLEALSSCDSNPAMLEHIGLRPGFTPTPFGPQKLVISESDIGALAATYVLSELSGNHALMVEPFNYNVEDGTFSMGHGGPNDYTDPEGSVLLGEDTRFAKAKVKYAGAPFAWYVMGPGEKTVVHISKDGDSFKVVAALADCIKEEHLLASYSHCRLKVRGGSPQEFTKFLMNIGVTQHYAVAAGNSLDAVRNFADIMGFKYYEFPSDK